MEKEKQIEVLKGIEVIAQRGALGKGDVKILVGDLVYDEKNQEYGIVLGVKPPIEFGETEINLVAKKSKFKDIPLQTFPGSQMCIIQTISKDNNELRIRYTNSKKLRRIEGAAGKRELTDLDTHCQYECFLECSSECSLWKYRTPEKH